MANGIATALIGGWLVATMGWAAWTGALPTPITTALPLPGGLPVMALALATLLGVHALKLGYRWQETAEGFSDLVRALQMRFAPEETGAPASHRLAARVAEMAERFPVDAGERRSSYAPGPSGRVHVSAPRPEDEGGGDDGFGPDFDLDTD